MSSTDPFGSRSEDRLRSMEDRELVDAVSEGRPEAVSELYDRYAGMLLALARRILGDAADAEEVLQEAFLQLWNQSKRYDSGRSSVSTWLALITRSRAIDRLRTRGVKQRTVRAAFDERPRVHTSPTGTANVLEQERRQRLREEMARLPEEQRTVLELAFYGGLTQREIAEKTGAPLGTVKTRTLLAMKKLRIALSDEIGELL